MADNNKFKVWIDISNNNVLSEADYAADSQRTNGFTSGTVASSKRVNSALRSSSLVTAALMGLVNNASLDLTSSLSDVQTALANYLSGLGSVTADPQAAANVIKFTVGSSSYEKTVNDVAHATSADTAGSATSAGSADSATNVTTQINGKAISTIFETNGTTVKNATSATRATAVNFYSTLSSINAPGSGRIAIYIGTEAPTTYITNVIYLTTSYTEITPV